MKLTIETALNGYILRRDDEDGEPPGVTLIAEGDPVDDTSRLLWEVLEMAGHVGSRYDRLRVRVVVEPGDKWEGPEGGA